MENLGFFAGLAFFLDVVCCLCYNTGMMGFVVVCFLKG